MSQPWPIPTPEIPSDYCNDPINLRTVVSGNLVTFIWDVPHDNDGFYLSYWEIGESPVEVTVFGSNYQVSLDPNTTYGWSVRTMCDRLANRGSSVVVGAGFTTGNENPSCPVIDLSGASIIQAANAIRIEWSAITGISAYEIEIMPDKNPGAVVALNVPVNYITFDILIPKKLYWYRVRPICDNNQWSNWATFESTEAGECDPLEINAITDITTMVVYWNDNASNKGLFNVYVNGTLVAENHPVNIITLIHLLPDTAYSIIVIPICGDYVGDMGTLTPVTLKQPVDNPTDLTGVVDSFNNILVSWTPAPAIDSQEIMVNGSKIALDATTSSYSIPGFAPGSKAHILVKSVKDELKSTGAFVEVTMPTFCPSIDIVNAVNITYNTIKLGWKVIPGAEYYVLGYRKASDATFVRVSTTQSSYRFKNLDVETEYVFEVVPICASGIAEVTTFEAATVALPDCPVPTELTVSDITDTTMLLSFVFPEDTGTFKITANATIFYASQSPFKLTGLTPDTEYEITVENNCGLQAITSDPVIASTIKICEAPPDLAAAMTTANTVLNINWTAVATITGYKVEYRKVGQDEWIVADESFNDISYNVTSADSAMYEVRVTSIFADGRRCASTAFSAIPQVLNLANEGNGRRIELSWDAIEGVESYKIVITSSLEVLNIFSLKASQRVELNDDTNYSVQVYGYYGEEYGTASDAITFNTGSFTYVEDQDCNAPDFVSYYQDAYLNDNSMARGTKTDVVVTLKNYSKEFRYEVRLINKAGAVPVATQSYISGDDSFAGQTIFKNVPDADYQVQVVVLLSGDKYCDNTQEVYDAQCSVPQGLEAANVTHNSFDITWTAVEGSQGYEVYLNDELLNIVSDPEYTFEGLTPVTDYVVKIRNICMSNRFSNPAYLDVTTTAAP